MLRHEKGEVRGNAVASVCSSTKQIIANSFSVFNIVANISHMFVLLIRHLPWKTKIQDNVALRKYNLMKQSNISDTNHLSSWHSKSAEMVIETNTCSYV